MKDAERIATLETEVATLQTRLETQDELIRTLTDDLERARSESQIANAAAASGNLIAVERATVIENALNADDGAPTNAILAAALQ